MGLGDADRPANGGTSAAAVTCSICLDAVTDSGDRSWAELQCGHKFHLGSAFNMKGAMQCPNCRKIEKGQWLYANGSRPFNMDDWAHDEDLYDLSFSEMSFGVHWCPISGVTRLPTPFEEGEFQSSAYHDLLGHQPIYAEHTPVSSTTHPCPYIAYFGPIHPSSTSSGSVSDQSGFNHWNGPSVPRELPGVYAFPSMDVHYHIIDHTPYPASNWMSSAEQPSIPSMTQRTSRNNYDIPRSGMHPFIVSHSAANRAPGSVSASVHPPYPGPVPRPHEHAPSLQAYIQQSSSSPIARTSLISTGRSRTSNHRGLAQAAPMTSSPDQSGGFYFFSSNSSGRAFQEAENLNRDRFHSHSWEREHQPTFPSSHGDRDSIWGPFHLPAGGSRSSSYRQRHRSERTPSQNWS